MKDITENLKKRMKELGYTQERLAAELGVTQAHINNLLNGRKAFGKKTAHEWHNRFGFNEAWLLTGTGEMLANAQTGNNNVGNNSNVSDSYNTSADALETILRLTKMLEDERAENARLKAEIAELKK